MAENEKKSWLQAWNAAAKAMGKASAGTGNPAPAKEKEYGADLREKMEAQKIADEKAQKSRHAEEARKIYERDLVVQKAAAQRTAKNAAGQTTVEQPAATLVRVVPGEKVQNKILAVSLIRKYTGKKLDEVKTMIDIGQDFTVEAYKSFCAEMKPTGYEVINVTERLKTYKAAEAQRIAEEKQRAEQKRRAEEQRLAMEKKRTEAAARQAEEQRLAAEKAAREAAERLEQHEIALAAFQEQLKKQTDALPPVGREIATQQGQRQLFDALAVVIPKLAECKEPPHRAARLYTEQLDDLDALFTAVSGVLTGTARILSGTGLETAAEQWPARSDAELLMGYKALRCYAELSEYPDEFNAAADLLAETLREREDVQKQKAQEAAAQKAAEAQTQQPEEMPSAGDPMSPPAGMLQTLLSSGENLEDELLASDPGELKRIIRSADSAERGSLMELLGRAIQKAEGEQKELLKIVYDFTDGVQKADDV